MMNIRQSPKQPEMLRRKLLDCTAQLAAEQGVNAVTVQAVAAAAGVTKGGLFHHFPSKEKLIEAVVRDQMEQFDGAIESHLVDDSDNYGCFTRAYLNVVLQLGDNPLFAQSLSLTCDPMLCEIWSDWLRGRLARHQTTDSSIELEIIRYAADGYWLTDLWRVDNDIRREREAVRLHLINATRKGG
ncbi:TetR/AcrR family transcriptional regulator [Xanthobacter variabilis]|jgi:AcrR family transcriptional regulator|uniref:TetR/AcrR family transcriptional regulator n=1 Tax=Xanthobacter variabilis TaxID=3119932 RepID=UPI0037293F8B